MIYVFLNNKLISCDTITPFLYEICKGSASARLRVFTFDDRTYNNICETELLYDAICEYGVLIRFTDHKRVSRHQSIVVRLGFRLRAILMLFWLTLVAMFSRPIFLHFKALNEWPLRVLFLFNKRRTFLCEASTAGITTAERETDYLIQDRDERNILPAASVAIGFSGKWQPPVTKGNDPLPYFYVGRPYLRDVWREYVRDKASKLMQEAGYKKEQLQLIYVLSSMDNNNMLQQGATFLTLFERTLALLHRIAPEVRILVRRHPATSSEYREYQDDIMARSVHQNVHVSNWHPAMLCHISCGMIANAYSSTFDLARSYGLETIEFTHYSDAFLNATNGQSTRPDITSFFIQNDDEGFSFAIKALLANADSIENMTNGLADSQEAEAGYKSVSALLSK